MNKKYIGHESGLIGPVTMEKPEFNYQFPPDGPSNLMLESAQMDYEEKCMAYEHHLASFTPIPCEGWTAEVGRVYEEGKDFELGAKHPDELNNNAPVFIAFPVAVPLTAPEDILTPEEFGAYVQDASVQPVTERGDDLRCEFEKCIIKYFGLPDGIDFNYDIRVNLTTLVDLLCAYKQSQPTYPAEFVEWVSNSGWKQLDDKRWWNSGERYVNTTAELFAGPYQTYLQSLK